MKLTGLQVRQGWDLDISVKDIFQIKTNEEGDEVSKEIFEEKITHSSEIENFDEIFGKENILFYSTKKREVKINENLIAYIFDFYICSLDDNIDRYHSKISSDKTSEIIFLNTKVLDYNDFCKNIMDAHSFLGKYPKGNFRKNFTGIGDFTMEEYSLGHTFVINSGLHLLNFFIKDSNLVSTISSIITASYESDIKEQRKYFNEIDYEMMLQNVRKHRMYISKGIDLGLK
jgi:hypothetical protein